LKLKLKLKLSPYLILAGAEMPSTTRSGLPAATSSLMILPTPLGLVGNAEYV
jgi:hypothetical protein